MAGHLTLIFGFVCLHFLLQSALPDSEFVFIEKKPAFLKKFRSISTKYFAPLQKSKQVPKKVKSLNPRKVKRNEKIQQCTPVLFDE